MNPNSTVRRQVRGEPGVAKTSAVQFQSLFSRLARRLLGLTRICPALRKVHCLEAECFVFATEGLLLTWHFTRYCEVRDE
jgi:hypothetical protein